MKDLFYNSHTTNVYSLNIENKLKFIGLDVKILDESNFADSEKLFARHLEEVNQSTVDRYQTEYQACLNYADKITDNVDFNNIRLFKNSITFCPLEKLTKLFNEKIAPNFFQVFPNGKIYLIRVPTIYRSRAAFIRMLYALKNHPSIDISKIGGFKTLRHWNIAEPQTIYRLVTSIILKYKSPLRFRFYDKSYGTSRFCFRTNRTIGSQLRTWIIKHIRI